MASSRAALSDNASLLVTFSSVMSFSFVFVYFLLSIVSLVLSMGLSVQSFAWKDSFSQRVSSLPLNSAHSLTQGTSVFNIDEYTLNLIAVCFAESQPRLPSRKALRPFTIR